MDLFTLCINDYIMSCQSCANLLSAYKRAVSLYATSVSEIKTLDGNGFHVPDPKTQVAAAGPPL